MIFMNVKLISVILLFSLFLILGTSSVFAQDNSTELIQNDTSVSDLGNSSDYYDSENWNLGEWVLDENGNVVHVTSNKSYSSANFSVDFNRKNGTDLRNNVSDVNKTQNISPMSSPSQMNHLWDEYIKDPLAFMEKYNPQPKAPPATWQDNVQNSSCYGPNSKEFIDFMNFVERTKVQPDVIKSKDVNVFYSKNNSYAVRILNPVGDSVGEGINVTFIFNGKKIKAKTDGNGYAGFRFSRQPGSYFVNVQAGNVTSKNKIIVKPLLKTKDISKKYKKSSKFTVRLVKINGKSVVKKIVKITFKGKTYKIKTNSKGIATFNIPKNLKIGKYSLKTCYGGCIVKNKLTVKK